MGGLMEGGGHGGGRAGVWAAPDGPRPNRPPVRQAHQIMSAVSHMRSALNPRTLAPHNTPQTLVSTNMQSKALQTASFGIACCSSKGYALCPNNDCFE